jgi:vitamin B12 transporter
VTGSRLPSDGANPRHFVVVLDRAAIERTPARSVEDLLETVAGVDVKTRGPMGVQSNVGIRGGTYDQTLFLIDGVKMLDPQVGHHNNHIPLTLDDIERIEVLKGPASRQYGPNAFAGAVNIITRKGRTAAARLQAMGGTNGLYELGFSGAAPVQLSADTKLASRFSLSRRRADGYPDGDSTGANTLFSSVNRLNTDFDILTASGAVELSKTEAFSVEATANYIAKSFGANRFYSVRFPTQYEETQTFFAALCAKIASVGAGLGGAAQPLTVQAYARTNNDYFLLRRENPAFYRNRHTSATYGVEVQQTLYTTLGATALGGEFAYDEIASNNLGNHNRRRVSIFAEHRFEPVENLTIEAGLTALYNSDWGWNASPGVNVGWRLGENLSLRGAAAQSFRVPTYTNLYYNDAATLGNPTLTPEQAWTFELGGALVLPLEAFTESLVGQPSVLKQVTINTGIFRRDARNLIDFVRPRDSVRARWEGRNINRGVVTGVDVQISAVFAAQDLSAQSGTHVGMENIVRAERASLSYTWLDPRFDVESGLETLYLLDQLSHHAVGSVDVVWAGASVLPLRNQWRVRYEQRLGFTGNWFVDVRLGVSLQALGLGAEVYAEASNLLGNVPQSLDFGGLPVAGRWLRAGVMFDVATLWK